MRTVVLASIKGHGRRYVAGMLAIVLGVGFVAAALMVLSSANSALTKAAGAPFVKADLVVSANGDSLDENKVTKVDGVASVAGLDRPYLKASFGNGTVNWVQAGTVPASPDLRWEQLARGRFPTKADEIVVGKFAADDRQLALGSEVSIWGADGKAKQYEVVGISAGTSGRRWDNDVQLFGATATALGGEGGPSRVLVSAKEGVDVDQLRERLAAALGDTAQVNTGAEAAEAEALDVTGGFDVMGAVLLGFAAISVFVAGLVVSNTFTIVLAQRTRELALLRCVGANRRQVFRGVLLESFLVGTIASLVGVAVGTALAAITTLGVKQLGPDLQLGTLEVTASSVLIPIAVGLVTTVLAALLPASKATRVSPLAALRPDLAVSVRSRGGVVRLVIALVVLVGGAAGLKLGADSGALPLGIGGGLLSFFGILLLGPVLAPAVIRLVSLVTTSLGGVPARVASTNAVRNPGRTAATSTALLVGVTLIVMMSVGALTVERTTIKALAANFPLDIAVRAVGDTLPRSTIDAVEGVDGLSAQTVVTGAIGKVGEQDLQLFGIDPAAAATVLRSTDTFDGLRDGVAVLPEGIAEELGVKQGGSLTVSTPAGKGIFQVRVGGGFSEANGVVLTPRDLARVAPDAGEVAVWARASDSADLTKTVHGLESAIGVDGRIEGGAKMRAEYYDLMNILLLVATGLLAVAVLIALVGVGNTLSLSVLERTREQALLRALGLTKGQLRRTLAGEAVLVASVAIVLGIPLGLLYGFAGAATLVGQAVGGRMAYGVPYGTLALVAGVALVAGLLASVLPARRAVRVKPAAALAEE
ncbi:ABC transporter permease [Tenggerimyces flavus]|uniref:ABC transporter permease n=1 Tax=Tenggerimyces flavus TaxID=1708749 RepID=A0ABV7YFC9_9ACTN|nr:ABC transporter permease [Tenggerimyces flavus]MBM7791354.1 putative ABC transport system permease protein [Tenggerimyces flavus]